MVVTKSSPFPYGTGDACFYPGRAWLQQVGTQYISKNIIMKLKSTSLAIMAFSAIAAVSSQGALVFTEDFGSFADGTTITTTNTDFTYVRTGTGSVAPSAINPSNLATGASGFVAATGGSLTGVGVGNTLPTSSVYTFSIDFQFTNVSAGDIVFGVGAGTSFTGNSTFTTAHGLFWLQSDNGNFERRTSSGWSDVGTGVTFSNATNYSLHVVANGSAAAVTYGAETLAAGTMDIWLGGVKIDDGVAVTSSLAATGFRVYSVSGTGVEIDNVQLWDSAVAIIPEPSAALIGGLGLLALLRRRRR